MKLTWDRTMRLSLPWTSTWRALAWKVSKKKKNAGTLVGLTLRHIQKRCSKSFSDCRADYRIDQNNTLSIASNLHSTPSTHPDHHHHIPTATATAAPRTLRIGAEREENIPRFSSHEKRAAYL